MYDRSDLIRPNELVMTMTMGVYEDVCVRPAMVGEDTDHGKKNSLMVAIFGKP